MAVRLLFAIFLVLVPFACGTGGYGGGGYGGGGYGGGGYGGGKHYGGRGYGGGYGGGHGGGYGGGHGGYSGGYGGGGYKQVGGYGHQGNLGLGLQQIVGAKAGAVGELGASLGSSLILGVKGVSQGIRAAGDLAVAGLDLTSGLLGIIPVASLKALHAASALGNVGAAAIGGFATATGAAAKGLGGVLLDGKGGYGGHGGYGGYGGGYGGLRYGR